jgi:uncharacterized glyoxalase superfamily protein PhnB
MDTQAGPRFQQVNVVVGDVGAAVGFYRLLGIDIPEAMEWPVGSGAFHVEAHHGDDAGTASFELDNGAMTAIYTEGVPVGKVIIGFEVGTSAAVDETYQRLTGAGHAGIRAPYNAFWGARYAVVQDPDGNPVGLMGPRDRAANYVPATPTP